LIKNKALLWKGRSIEKQHIVMDETTSTLDNKTKNNLIKAKSNPNN